MNDYLSFDPAELPLPQAHGYLLGAVGPRPIAFASTLDRDGRPNLAPFSYFNVFSTRPPILIFGPNRSGRSGKNKDTVNNVLETFEVVVNIVNYAIVQQTNVAAAEYPPGVDEFVQAGLTPLPSEVVKPFRVAESPVQLECRVRQVLVLGSEGGSGNLIMCEVVRMHVNPAVLDADGRIDPHKIDLVARMGGNWYCRANGDALFEVAKPGAQAVLGFEGLPAGVRHSTILTGNELGMLANVYALPDAHALQDFRQGPGSSVLADIETVDDLHRAVKHLLQKGAVELAWLVLLSAEVE